MADIDHIEMRYLERLLISSPGYVLDFSSPTFRDFVIDSVQVDLYHGDKYEVQGTSKANRWRCFCDIEPNPIVGKLLQDLIEYRKLQNSNALDLSLVGKCKAVAERLRLSSPMDHVDRLSEHISADNVEKLINSLRDAVQRNEPESAIDRLHTLVLAFARERCDMHGVSHGKGEPLHSVFGKYVNSLTEKGLIESKMARSILKESVKLVDTFNDVRNNFSAAHANQLLTQPEAYLILGWVRGALDFVLSVDHDARKEWPASSPADPGDDLPF